jgi:hypothetical protein
MERHVPEEKEETETMRTSAKHSVGALLVMVSALVLATVHAAPVEAQKRKSKTVQTEAEWITYDAEAQTITVKVTKPGRENKDKALKKNKDASFNVKAEGSVLTKTTVAVRGRKAELIDIPEGKTVNVYWVPDEKNEGARFARKIDVILSDEELDEMYPDADSE